MEIRPLTSNECFNIKFVGGVAYTLSSSSALWLGIYHIKTPTGYIYHPENPASFFVVCNTFCYSSYCPLEQQIRPIFPEYSILCLRLFNAKVIGLLITNTTLIKLKDCLIKIMPENTVWGF
jgi:hypothetical protein